MIGLRKTSGGDHPAAGGSRVDHARPSSRWHAISDRPRPATRLGVAIGLVLAAGCSSGRPAARRVLSPAAEKVRVVRSSPVASQRLAEGCRSLTTELHPEREDVLERAAQLGSDVVQLIYFDDDGVTARFWRCAP